MSKQPPGPRRVDKRLVGEPIQVDGYSVQPVARLSGFSGFGGGKNGGGGGGWLTLTPQEVIVRNGEAGEQHVALPDPTALVTRSMAITAMAVAVVAWIIVAVAWLAQTKRSRQQ